MLKFNPFLKFLFLKIEREEVRVITGVDFFEASITHRGFEMGYTVNRSERHVSYFLKTLIGNKKFLIKKEVIPNQKAGC